METNYSMMAQSKTHSLLVIAVALIVLLPSHIAAADRKAGAGKAGKLEQTYTWHDGRQERKVWLNPELVAEFERDADRGDQSRAVTALRRHFPDIVQVQRHGKARLFRLGKRTGVTAAIATMASEDPTGKYSPVLHETRSDKGRKRALPGNIIVYLDPAWKPLAVQNWFASRKLEVIETLKMGPNIFLVKSGAGLEALELANTLYGSGEVVAAFPDWWEEMVAQ